MKSGMYNGFPYNVCDGHWSTLHAQGECKSDQHGAMLAKRSIRRRQLRIERQTKAYQEAQQCASQPQ